MKPTPTPVSRNDPDEQVLERILTTLDDSGPMPIDEIVKVLHLYEHPAAEKILNMAIGDGMVEPLKEKQLVQIGEFGRIVARDIRDSRGAMKGGTDL